MVVNQKPTGRASSMSAGLAWGAGISLSVTILSAAVLAKLLDTEKLAWENVGYGVMVLLLLASFLGAIVSCNKIKRQRLMVSLLSGAIYFGILLSITALLFGGQYEAVGVTAALVMGGSSAAGLLGLKESGGGKRRKASRYHR